MSKIVSTSSMSQENNVSENAAVVQVKTQSFSLGQKKYEIRILGSDEDMWFVADDVGRVLGMNNMAANLKNYRDGTEKGLGDVKTPGGTQKMLIMSEKAMYKFINRSHKPEAEPFQDWVADILRTIRIEGRYELQTSQTKMLMDAESARKFAEREAQEAKAALVKANEEKIQREKLLDKLRRQIKNKHEKRENVYLLRNPSDRSRSLWKVGRTNDLSNREAQYGTAMPDGPEIVHCRHTTNSKLVETLVMHVIDDYRYEPNHEWFQGDPEYFASLIDMAVDFVDGLIETGEKATPFGLKEKLSKLLKKAKRFDPDDDEDAQSDDSGTSSITINHSGSGSINITLPDYTGLIRDFKSETLQRVETSPGVINKDVCICHRKLVDVFNQWHQRKFQMVPTSAQVWALKSSFGKPSDGNWSRAGWTRRLGYEPPSSKKTETWRGWYGLRWKPGVIDDISSM